MIRQAVLWAAIAGVLAALIVTTAGCAPIARGTRLVLPGGAVLEQYEQSRLWFFGGEWEQAARVVADDRSTSATLSERKTKVAVDSLGSGALGVAAGYLAGGMVMP